MSGLLFKLVLDEGSSFVHNCPFLANGTGQLAVVVCIFARVKCLWMFHFRDKPEVFWKSLGELIVLLLMPVECATLEETLRIKHCDSIEFLPKNDFTYVFVEGN